MDLYIKWSFWLGIVSIVLRLFTMSSQSYPRTAKWSLEEDTVAILISSFFAFWAWRVIYM